MIITTLSVVIAGLKNRVSEWFASETPGAAAGEPKPRTMPLDTRVVVLEMNTHDWIPTDAFDRPLPSMTFVMGFRDAFDIAVMLNRRTLLAPKLGNPGANLHWFAVVRTNTRKTAGHSVLKVLIRGAWTPSSEYELPQGITGGLMPHREAVDMCRAFNAQVLAGGVLEGPFQWMLPVRPLWDPREDAKDGKDAKGGAV